MRGKCWVFLFVFKARILGLWTFEVIPWGPECARWPVNSHRTRTSDDIFGKLKDHSVPHHHQNSETAEMGRTRRMSCESRGGAEVSPMRIKSAEQQTHPIPASIRLWLMLQVSMAVKMLGIRTGLMPRSWGSISSSFLTVNNSLLIEISLRKFGSYVEIDKRKFSIFQYSLFEPPRCRDDGC